MLRPYPSSEPWNTSAYPPPVPLGIAALDCQEYKDYTPPTRAKSSDCSPVLQALGFVAGALVLCSLLYWLLVPPTTYGPSPRSLASKCAANFSTLLGAVSARLSGTTTSSSPNKQSAKAKYPTQLEGKRDVPLIDAEGDYKAMDDEERQRCLETARAELAAHPRAVVMLFAPWCPHCKTAMPRFADAAAAVPGAYLMMVNSEALPRHDSLFGLDKYPTFAVQTAAGEGLTKEIHSLDPQAIKAELGPETPPPPSNDGAAGEEGNEGELDEDGEGDNFASLF